MLNVCTQVLAHTPVYFYDKNISSRTILVHWINLKMTFKSYWYIYRMCCSYNTELPSFHKHIEASHRVVVVSYTETNGIPPPFLIWTKTCSGTPFFRLIARLYFFRCACIFYREKNSYSILHTISHLWQFYIAMSNTSLRFFFLPRAHWRIKNV